MQTGEDNVRKIKDRLDIVDVISAYIKVQKAGINYKARCPFHNEKTPSFFITPERQIWHCFGCAKGGDMFEFVKEIEGVEFPEALKILASRAGVELEQFRPAERGVQDEKAKLYEICELATKFFQKQFQSSIGKQALSYLLDRGLNQETIQDFRLGYAPDEWESLSGFLKVKGYSEKDIIDAGLAIKRNQDSSFKREGVYDRFRSRIIFPIADISGQVVGFTGRVFESPTVNVDKSIDADAPTMAKYINSPGTLIYDKSRILYGLLQAKLEIKRADQCILVEGNMDALMSYQAGTRNVVATSGTALTPHHLRLLQRYTKNLGFCFDTDQAGAAATRRGIGLALAGQFNIRVLELRDPECKDPADFVKKHGVGWVDAVAGAKSVIDYYFDRARASYQPASAESKKDVIAAVAPFVKRLSSSVERSHWVAQLSSLLRAPEQAIAQDIASFKDDLDAYTKTEGVVAAEGAIAAKPAMARQLPDMLNEAILSVILHRPPLFREMFPLLPYELFDAQTAGTIRRIEALPDPVTFADLVADVPEDEALPLEFANLRSQELWNDFSDDQLKGELGTLCSMLRRRSINARIASLQFDIKEAETANDTERLSILAKEFESLAVQLQNIHAQKETKKEVTQKTEAGFQKIDPASREVA